MLLLPLAENAVKHGPAAGHGGDNRARGARAPGHGPGRGVAAQPGRVSRPRPAAPASTSSSGDWRSPTMVRDVDDRRRRRRHRRGGDAADDDAARRDAHVNDAPVEPLRVLVADDEAIARRRLLRLLAAMPGVAVAGECADAHQVLDRIRAGGVDAVVARHPDAGAVGIEALQLFPADGPAVIFCTPTRSMPWRRSTSARSTTCSSRSSRAAAQGARPCAPT